jgi:hypothetical protein
MSTGKVTDVSVEYCASIFRVSIPRRRFYIVFSHPTKECLMKEKGEKQNLRILTVCYCELPSSVLVNSFCHGNVQASDSKSDT